MSFTSLDPLTQDANDLIDAFLASGSPITVFDATFSGGATFSSGAASVSSASFYNGGIEDLGIDPGILLTSGDSTPPLTNTETGYSTILGTPGDDDLDTVAQSAFAGAGETFDATVLEFEFTVPAGTNGIRFDLIFASDEFPEYSNSSFVDVAAVFINGQNVGLFNNQLDQPLSVIDRNINLGNFRDNTGATQTQIDLEYDGISDVTTVQAPVQSGINTLKLAIADTGDTVLDSGLFLANLDIATTGGGGLLINLTGTDGDDDLTGTDSNEFLDAGGGNDNIDPGAGDDVVDAGPGDDIIKGGQGNNDIDGGEGSDTVEYDGPQGDFPIEVLGNLLKVGSNTDTIVNVETLSFTDGDVDTAELLTGETRVLLENNASFRVAQGAEIVARSGGSEAVLINDGVTGVRTNAEVERIDLGDDAGNFSFQAGGSGLTISKNGQIVLTVPSLNQTAELRFADGDASLQQTGALSFTIVGGSSGTTVVGQTATTLTVNLGSNLSATSTPGPGDLTGPGARVLIGENENYRFADNADVFGRSGTSEGVLIEDGVFGLESNAEIDRIDLALDLSAYTFEVTVNGLEISTQGQTVITVPSLNQAIEIRFADGDGTLQQTGAQAFELQGGAGGQATIDTTPGTPSVSLGSNISLTAASGAQSVTAGDDGATLDAGSGDVNFQFGSPPAAGYGITIDDFSPGDVLDLTAINGGNPAGVTVVPDGGNDADGIQMIQFEDPSSTGVVTLTLTGLTNTEDAGLFNAGSIDTVFGAGTLLV